MKLCTVLLLAFCGPACAQQSTPAAEPSFDEFLANDRAARMPARVRVSLHAKDDKDLESQIRSYIGRELRSLRDVVLVDADPDYDLLILAMQVDLPVPPGPDLREVVISWVTLRRPQ